ncbi:isoflavone reductase family protein-like protein CipA [Plenodomus tracheiphilus IPT5]|uniref:Isoflavone reductase family protein-like protein CipA n=1 Tax=Plenodomus tracheiphilus IPT5 TaxID=1408161 RepID=A0A6A7B310_9PLEO|nr:isoflavone reductase family protein-like protein CipA [Plenodomus tracheiphilus IPT5]
MSIKNVIIIGAGGNLGPAILNAFLKDSSFNTTVLSRQGSKSTFPSGVKVVRADYESVSSLKEAFQGQDAVVSLVAGEALGDQNKLIDAAIEAGVQRFIPSEFGSNTQDKRTREIVPIFEAKLGTVNYLKERENKISWTSVVNGPFFDWGLKVGFLGFNGANKTATILDDGKAVFSATNLHQIGLALIKSLEKADLTKNQVVYINSFQTSQEQILDTVEKISGVKWTVDKQSANSILEDATAKFQKGDYSSIPALIQVVTFRAGDNLGDFAPVGLWNDKLGLPKEDFEASVRSSLGL